MKYDIQLILRPVSQSSKKCGKLWIEYQRIYWKKAPESIKIKIMLQKGSQWTESVF
jgi:hypothetical protein